MLEEFVAGNCDVLGLIAVFVVVGPFISFETFFGSLLLFGPFDIGDDNGSLTDHFGSELVISAITLFVDSLETAKDDVLG